MQKKVSTSTTNDNQQLVELINFVEQYSSLLDRQLAGIRRDMSATVEEIMTQVGSMSSTRGSKTQLADTIFVKAQEQRKADDTALVAASAKELEMREQVELEAEWLAKYPGNLSPEAMAVGSKLREHMDSLDHLDKRLEKMMFTIVGALSTEDVVGQSIDHSAKALTFVRDMLKEVLGIYQSGEANADALVKVAAATRNLEERIYATYTMEAEKKTFCSVYGAAPAKAKKSK